MNLQILLIPDEDRVADMDDEGVPMTIESMITEQNVTPPVGQGNAAEHLWMHFTRMSSFANKPVPTIERGEGAYIWDTNGRKRVCKPAERGRIRTPVQRRRIPLSH